MKYIFDLYNLIIGNIHTLKYLETYIINLKKKIKITKQKNKKIDCY